MSRLSLGFSLFWVALAILPTDAWGHALSCTNSSNYTYFTEDSAAASRCKNYFDSECVWIGAALTCKWQGSYHGNALKNTGQTPAGDKQPLPPLPSPMASLEPPSIRTEAEPESVPENENSSTIKTAMPMEPLKPPMGSIPTIQKEITNEEAAAKTAELAKKAKELEEAMKEAKISSGKVEELKFTMEEIKVNNQNNAVLYRSPDADVGSVDPRFNAFNAKLSGEVGGSTAAAGLAGGLLGNGFRGNHPSAKDKTKNRDRSGRGLASADSGEVSVAKDTEASASAKGESSSATSDNPWVTYMGQTSKAGLIDRLRKNPNLRDSLRDRIAELQANGDKSGVVELMEEALASAEKESQGPNLDDLKPMAFMEAFSMDANETEAQIRSLIADLDTVSDPQFLPQISLFERVSVAHRRSLVRGSVKSVR